MKKPSRTQQLHDAGFDRSRYDQGSKSWSVRCSQCEALVINGVATHERGCPNIPRHYEVDDE